MFVKHIFGLFTMIFFVVLSSGIKKNIFNIVKGSILLYILFILITKCQIYIFYIILLILGITYIINILKQEENENNKTESTEEKPTQKKDSFYDNLLNILYAFVMILIVLGVIMYMGEKKIEYKNNFDYITFFIGKSVCIGKSPNINMFKSIKSAFT
jgi:Ca2+/Na+ antiporter